MVAPIVSRCEATAANIRRLRNQVAGMARECGLDESSVADVKIAVSEAATNAWVHGYRSGPGEIELHAEVVDGELRVAISDEGEGMRPRPDSPGLGLGLPLIATVAERFEVVHSSPGTELRMAFACPSEA